MEACSSQAPPRLLDQRELWEQVRPSTYTLPGARALIHTAHPSAGLLEASFMETMPKDGQCHLMKLHAHFLGELPALLNLLPRRCLPSQGGGDPASFGRVGCVGVGGRLVRLVRQAGHKPGRKAAASVN